MTGTVADKKHPYGFPRSPKIYTTPIPVRSTTASTTMEDEDETETPPVASGDVLDESNTMTDTRVA